MKDHETPDEADERDEGDEGGPVDVVTSRGRSAWLPLVAIIVLMPAISYAMMEYWMFPRLDVRLAAVVSGEDPRNRKADTSDGLMHSHTFDDIIVNVSGTLGTRYLKTSFTIHSQEADVTEIVQSRHSRILDAALGTLSTLRLQDLEQPGARNFVRNELIDSINSSIGRPIVQELYFLDFVVQ